jgi:hypothetical protein
MVKGNEISGKRSGAESETWVIQNYQVMTLSPSPRRRLHQRRDASMAVPGFLEDCLNGFNFAGYAYQGFCCTHASQEDGLNEVGTSARKSGTPHH